jgi:hypothetical protein
MYTFKAHKMKKILLFTFALFIGTGLFARPDEPVPTNHSSYSWHTVTLVDFKPGTEESAKQLIQKFESATSLAGTKKPSIHWFESGKYDLVITWNLENSPSNDKWTWSPEGEDWWKALVSQEGSAEAAEKLQEDYSSMVASSVTNVSRKAK